MSLQAGSSGLTGSPIASHQFSLYLRQSAQVLPNTIGAVRSAMACSSGSGLNCIKSSKKLNFNRVLWQNMCYTSHFYDFMSSRDYFIFGGLLVLILAISILSAKGVELNDKAWGIFSSVVGGLLTAFRSGRDDAN